MQLLKDSPVDFALVNDRAMIEYFGLGWDIQPMGPPNPYSDALDLCAKIVETLKIILKSIRYFIFYGLWKCFSSSKISNVLFLFQNSWSSSSNAGDRFRRGVTGWIYRRVEQRQQNFRQSKTSGTVHNFMFMKFDNKFEQWTFKIWHLPFVHLQV